MWVPHYPLHSSTWPFIFPPPFISFIVAILSSQLLPVLSPANLNPLLWSPVLTSRHISFSCPSWNLSQVNFESQVMNVGTLAVGKESFFTAKLKNSGVTSAVFYITSPLGMKRSGERQGEREREREGGGESEIIVTPTQVNQSVYQYMSISIESDICNRCIKYSYTPLCWSALHLWWYRSIFPLSLLDIHLFASVPFYHVRIILSWQLFFSLLFSSLFFSLLFCSCYPLFVCLS